MAGKNIRQKTLRDMRTVDFYPTLLEYCGIRIPKGRQGYVMDIFQDKVITNHDRLFNQEFLKREQIALIQNMEVPEFNRIINEVFLQHRFADITLYSEGKYANVFRGNQRVREVKLLENLSQEDISSFDRVIVGYRNLVTNGLRPLEIVGLPVAQEMEGS